MSYYAATSMLAGRRASPESRPSPPLMEEVHAATFALTPQIASESEGDLESESDLPTMATPLNSDLPLRIRNIPPPEQTSSNDSRPADSLAIMPQMQRAHSSPGVDSLGRVAVPGHAYPRRPSSPLSSGRRRSPLRGAFEEPYPASSWGNLSIEPNIPEHAELELSTPATPEHEFGTIPSIPTYNSMSNTFPRSRRRPTSPLHQSASAPSLNATARAASPYFLGGSSPSFSTMSTAKFANEPYPTYGYSFSSTSSMPSTPTSLRSRSPSISSLDTIEDIPDAEEAARLEDEMTKPRANEDNDGSSETKKKSSDSRAIGLRSNKDRKRWSVCGAERRADFSLERIEE